MQLFIEPKIFNLKNTTLIRIVLVILVSLPSIAFAQQGNPNEMNRSFEPEVEIQKEDYRIARSKFRTNLLKKTPSPQTVSMPVAPEDVTVVKYPSGNLQLAAWINQPKKNDGQKIPAVIFLHGGFSFIKAQWEQAESFRKAGFVVMMPVLRGENGQAGNFSFFYDEVDDVLAAVDFLSKQPFVDKRNIFVAGHSIGGVLTLLAAEASDKFRAAASFSGSPDQKLLLQFGFPKDQIPFDQTDPREFQMRSPLAYASSLKVPTRIYYGGYEKIFDATSRKTAEIARNAKLDVQAIVTPGNHESHVYSSVRQSIEFFKTFMKAKSLAVLKARNLPDEQPCAAGSTVFKLNGYETAQAIALAGNFNEWNPQKLFFIKEDGGWICRVNLLPGRYSYKFVVDRRWIFDPKNPEKMDDGNGGQNSVIVVQP